MKTLALGLSIACLAANLSPCGAADEANSFAYSSSAPADAALASLSMPDSGSTSPLTLDIEFNAGNLAFNDGVGDSYDHNLRVFSRIGGYYLTGYHASNGTNESFIYSVSLDGSSDSFATRALPFRPVDVANVPGTTRFYFIGGYLFSPTSDYDFGVYCVDFSTNAACSSFGNNGPGLVTIPIDSNGAHSDFPVKIIADGSNALYIAGTSSSASGLSNLDISVAAIDPTLGSPLAGFGNRAGNPGTMVFGFDRTTNAVDRSTNLLVTAASSPGGHRLYIVGESQFSADGLDTDGFVLALNAATGAKISSFGVNGIKYVFNDIGQTNKQDVIDAITQTRDGQLAMTGHSTDDDGNQILSLAEMDTDGDYTTGFCGSGHCTVPVLSTYNEPADITERSGTRDLVIATTLHNDFGGAADGHPYQAIWEFGRTGNVLHALTSMDFPSNVAPANSSPADVLIAFDGSVLMAGSRKSGQLGANDYDMTLTRFIDTDTIFANQFETVF